jgi:hypothetical protein
VVQGGDGGLEVEQAGLVEEAPEHGGTGAVDEPEREEGREGEGLVSQQEDQGREERQEEPGLLVVQQGEADEGEEDGEEEEVVGPV